MEYRSLGGSGLAVSVAGLGCNNFGMRIDYDATVAVLDAAIDAGINFFDTARSYGGGKSEEFMGQALEGRRDSVIIATKFGSPTEGARTPGSRQHVLRSVEASLRALRTDYIDLYQLHFPDATTPIEETLSALDLLVQQGKVRYVGCSNFAGWMIADAHWIASTRGFERFITVQNEWSLLSRAVEGEVTAACGHFGASILPYFPLASGMLTGKVQRGEQAPEGSRLRADYFAPTLSEANFDRLDKIRAWADDHGRPLLEVALSWLASQPVVGSVIAGATSPAQVQANAAATKTDLTADDIAELGAAAA
ncbi:MAG: aldo/keto reductase [Acidimicrobiales bacterium]|nr:aldo/keto reductase [Acidimicrobiales bacterium]